MHGVTPERAEIEYGKTTAKGKDGDSGFEIIPSLSVRKKNAVLPLDDGFRTFGSSFEDCIMALGSKHEKILLVDYDGLISNKPQYDLIQKIQDISKDNDFDIEIWVEAGVRAADSAIDVFVAGADAAVISTSLIADLNELKKACEMSGDIILSLDFDANGMVVSDKSLGSKTYAELVKDVMGFGISKIILDCVVTDASPDKACDMHQITQDILQLNPAPSVYVHKKSQELGKESEALKNSGVKGVLLDITEDDIAGAD